jgi:polar amino acid transport system substrate-binding protein
MTDGSASTVASRRFIGKFTLALASLVAVAWPSAPTPAETLVIASQDVYLARVCETIVREALEESDLDVEFRVYPGARALRMSNSGAIDGEMCRLKAIERAYPNLVRVDPLVAPLVMHAFSWKPAFPVEGWHSLKPYSIAIRRGHVFVERQTRGMRTQAIGTDLQILRMLDSRRVDIAVLLTGDALRVMHDEGIKGIKALFPRLVNMSAYLYLHKKHAALVPRIAASLRKMAENGRSRAIYTEHISSLHPQPVVLRDLVEAFDLSEDPR